MLNVFRKNLDKAAIVWKDKPYEYRWLLERIDYWEEFLQNEYVKPGTVAVIEADFSPNSVALFMALIQHACILVPITASVKSKRGEFIETAKGEISFVIDEGDDNVEFNRLPYSGEHELYQRLRQVNHPGIVFFTSGSTGKSKAVVHDLLKILVKFEVSRHVFTTLTFLLYDHIGGVNTMLYTLSNAGSIVTVQDRDPDTVLGAIEKYQIELLPTSPTFINLILLSEAYKRHKLNSLKIVTYGTEPMPESTLNRFHQLFPDIRLLQTYGLSEVGILRSKSRSSDSRWVKVGGEGYETRVMDGILQIKAKSAMLGYLNAPTPFAEDGWFITDDCVEVQGEYMRFLGRKSENINVGGEKVYPAEVENVIQQMENVCEANVYSEKNPIVGNIVCANVSLLHSENSKKFTLRLKKYCRERMQNYKVPVKVRIVTDKQHSDRFKKVRAYG